MLQRLAFLGCSFGTGVFSAFNNFTLTLWLAPFASSYLLISLLGNSRAFVGALVSPAVGGWSDRVWLGRLGRRRPFILAGTVLAGLGMALTPAVAGIALPFDAAWLPREVALLGPAIVLILLYTAWYNAADDIHQALLVDITTVQQRNRLSGLSVVTHFAGQVAILLLGFALWSDGVPGWAFGFTAALMMIGALVTVVGVREALPPDPLLTPPWGRCAARTSAPPTSSATRDPHGIAMERGSTDGACSSLSIVRETGGTDTRGSPLHRSGEGLGVGPPSRGALVFGLVYFCYWSGVNAVMPLISVYTQDILGASVGEAQLLPALLLLSTATLALPMSWLGDRYGRKRVMTAGYAIVGGCGLAGLVITTREQGAVVFLLAGIGNAASMVLTVPLLAELVPAPRIGAATGLLAASGSLAAPIASLVAGIFSDLYGPRAIFGLMAIMIALALALMPAVRKPTSISHPKMA
jgi:MFS family permease